MDAGLGYGTSPDQLFAAAGLNKTGSYDVNGHPVDTPQPQQSPSDEVDTDTAESTFETPSFQAPQPTQPTTTEFDWNGKFDGKFKSFDELESYVRDVEAKANKDPFANDLVRNLNKAISEGIDPELYLALTSMDIDSLSERDALVLEMQWKKGLSLEDAEFLVDRTYKLGDGEYEADASDPDVREAQIRLKLDAQEAKGFLSSYKQEGLTSPYEKQQQEITQAWTPVIPQVLDRWKTFKVESKAGTFNVPTSPAAMEAAKSLLQEVVQSGYLQHMPDSEGLEVAHAIIEKEILKHDFQTAIDYIGEAMKAKQLEEKHNPRKPVGQYQAPMSTQEQSIVDFLKKVRG